MDLSTLNVGTVIGFVLTLMIFSYVLGDNFLYRLAVYVFVGVAAAYVAIVTVENIIAPLLLSNQAGDLILLVVAVILAASLVFKGSLRLGWLGNLALALLIAVGSAVALVGAVTGTLIPLTLEAGTAARTDGLVNGAIILIGVASSLVYFQYLARRTPDGTVQRRRPIRLLAVIGQGFIVITLGALYAGAIITSLTIFSERIGFLLRGG